MGTATSTTIQKHQRTQFAGLFEEVRVVDFTVDPGSISPNAVDETAVTVTGLDPLKDVVLGWTHHHEVDTSHELIETFHTWHDSLHLLLHNSTGGAVDSGSTIYRVVIGRLVTG